MKFHTRKFHTRLALAGLIALGLAACGERRETAATDPGREDAGLPADAGTEAGASGERSAGADVTGAPAESTYSGAVGRTENPNTATTRGSAEPGGTALEGEGGPRTGGGQSGIAGAAARDFLVDAANAGMMQIQTAQLAVDKARSAEVKELANLVAEDHERSSSALGQLAQSRGVTVPQKPTDDMRRQLEELQGLSGTRFDRAYASQQVEAHRRAVELYERAAKESTDSEIRAFAEEHLPALRRHLKMAQALPGADDRG